MADQHNLGMANLKMAVNVFFRTVFSAVLAIILYMSLMMIITGFATKNIGERIVEYDETAGTTRIVSQFYYSETTTTASAGTTVSSAASASAGSQTGPAGTTSQPTGAGTTSAETTASGGTGAAGAEKTTATTVETLPSNQRREVIRSEIPAGTQLIFDIVAQVLMLILLLALPYSKLWLQGDKDSNAVHFGHMTEDKLRGLKVGLMAAIPSFIVYFILFLSKLGLVFPKFIYTYRLLNLSFLPLVNRVIGTNIAVTADISWLSMLALLLTVAAVPFICWLSYLLGYKHISVSEKLIYVDPQKKKKRRR